MPVPAPVPFGGELGVVRGVAVLFGLGRGVLRHVVVREAAVVPPALSRVAVVVVVAVATVRAGVLAMPSVAAAVAVSIVATVLGVPPHTPQVYGQQRLASSPQSGRSSAQNIFAYEQVKCFQPGIWPPRQVLSGASAQTLAAATVVVAAEAAAAAAKVVVVVVVVVSAAPAVVDVDVLAAVLAFVGMVATAPTVVVLAVRVVLVVAVVVVVVVASVVRGGHGAVVLAPAGVWGGVFVVTWGWTVPFGVVHDRAAKTRHSHAPRRSALAGRTPLPLLCVGCCKVVCVLYGCLTLGVGLQPHRIVTNCAPQCSIVRVYGAVPGVHTEPGAGAGGLRVLVIVVVVSLSVIGVGAAVVGHGACVAVMHAHFSAKHSHRTASIRAPQRSTV